MIVTKKKKKKKKKKKRTCRIVDFAVPADHRLKLKEGKKRDKYLDLARELLYTIPMSINGYFQFLITTLDTIVRGG